MGSRWFDTRPSYQGKSFAYWFPTLSTPNRVADRMNTLRTAGPDALPIILQLVTDTKDETLPGWFLPVFRAQDQLPSRLSGNIPIPFPKSFYLQHLQPYLLEHLLGAQPSQDRIELLMDKWSRLPASLQSVVAGRLRDGWADSDLYHAFLRAQFEKHQPGAHIILLGGMHRLIDWQQVPVETLTSALNRWSARDIQTFGKELSLTLRPLPDAAQSQKLVPFLKRCDPSEHPSLQARARLVLVIEEGTFESWNRYLDQVHQLPHGQWPTEYARWTGFLLGLPREDRRRASAVEFFRSQLDAPTLADESGDPVFTLASGAARILGGSPPDDREPDPWPLVFHCWQLLANPSESLDFAMESLHSPSRHRRWHASEMLVHKGRMLAQLSERKHVAALRKALRDENLRSVAIHLLDQYGAQAESALPELRQIASGQTLTHELSPTISPHLRLAGRGRISLTPAEASRLNIQLNYRTNMKSTTSQWDDENVRVMIQDQAVQAVQHIEIILGQSEPGH